MLLHIFLLFVVFAFIILLISFSWESWFMSTLSAVLFFALAALSIMVEIPYCGSTYTFSDYGGSIIFFILGVFSIVLTVMFRLSEITEEAEEYGEQDESSVV